MKKRLQNHLICISNKDPYKNKILVKRHNKTITLVKKYLVRLSFEKYTNFIDWRLTPSFSHRYGAVAAGIRNLGWSSNVLTPEFGANVMFNTVITDSPLESDPLLEGDLCDGCRICTRVCQVGMIHPKEKSQVIIGGKIFTHGRKGHNLRCILCCAGFTGQSKYKDRSTWSPGRITLPESDDQIEDCCFIGCGISLGGYLAIRAAAFEPRIKRVVAMDVMADFFECFSSRAGAVKEKLMKPGLVPLKWLKNSVYDFQAA
ncbi:MAG: hypothetical protein KJ737_05560 [Proteobacteria bacterium]|nr:hypothetical protein [Pseudomonadota bacterium]